MDEQFLLTPPPLKRHHSTPSWSPSHARAKSHQDPSELGNADYHDMESHGLDPFIEPESLGLDKMVGSSASMDPPRRDYNHRAHRHSHHRSASSADDLTIPFTPGNEAPRKSEGQHDRLGHVLFQTPKGSSTAPDAVRYHHGAADMKRTATHAGTYRQHHTSPLKREIGAVDYGQDSTQYTPRLQECGINPYYSSPWQFCSPQSTASISTPMSTTSNSTRLWAETPNTQRRPNDSHQLGNYCGDGLRASPMAHSVSEGLDSFPSPYARMRGSSVNDSQRPHVGPLTPQSSFAAGPQATSSSIPSRENGPTSASASIAAAHAILHQSQNRPSPPLSSHSSGSSSPRHDSFGLKRSVSLHSPYPHPAEMRARSNSMNTGYVPLVVSQMDKPHECDKCARRFKRLEHLRRHEKTHTGERQFACQVPGCDRMFSRADNLRAHERTHYKKGGRNLYIGDQIPFDSPYTQYHQQSSPHQPSDYPGAHEQHDRSPGVHHHGDPSSVQRSIHAALQGIS